MDQHEPALKALVPLAQQYSTTSTANTAKRENDEVPEVQLPIGSN